MLQTPLAKYHSNHGAKTVEFAGWEMPMMYTGVVEEHKRVRESAGLFDVSHMARFSLKGRHARRLLERVCTRRITSMQPGQCRYSLMCNERGGVHDDVIVYRLDDDDFLVVVNAANRCKIWGHLGKVVGDEDLKVTMEDKTESTAMVALQGPKVMDLVARVSSEVPTLKRYRFTVKNLVVMKLIVSRTGYTGEDGVEVILPAKAVDMALKLLIKESEGQSSVLPCGLGARDTLRLEAGMPLYGHELGEEICALSSGVDFAIALDKGDDDRVEPFIGMEALRKVRDAGGPDRVLAGITLEGRRTPRAGMRVHAGGREVGEVSSGCLSPVLEKPIAMAFVERGSIDPGTAVEIDTGRGDRLAGEITTLPFYNPTRSA